MVSNAASSYSNRRTFMLQKYTWPLTLVIAVGGLWWPRLGLLVIPIMLTLLSVSFFRGRFWCGNFCSHGSLFEYVLGTVSRKRQIPKLIKSPVVVWGFLAFFGYSIVRRLIAVAALWGEWILGPPGICICGPLSNGIDCRWDCCGINSPRTWCSFCPMGTMQKLSYKLGQLSGAARLTDRKVTISDSDKCRSCRKCAVVCPMELSPHLNFSDKNQFDSLDCIRCGKCVAACPFKLLTIEKAS